MNIEEALIDRHGCLLTIASLAKVLGRSPEGLRTTLRPSNTSEWALRVNSAKLRVGRRIYFRTSEIASMLMEQ